MYTDALYQVALQYQADLRSDARRGRFARLVRCATRGPVPDVVPSREPSRVVRPRPS